MLRPQAQLDLIARSLNILHSGQALNGAFIASPNFPVYRYCWFRDGTFIAHALDLWGDHEAARRFYDWAACTVLRDQDSADAALAAPPEEVPVRYLHTRYALDGSVADDDWPNFQLDGFGTLLWGMVEHLRLSGSTTTDTTWRDAIDLLVPYLAHLWPVPNYDCWEEFPDKVHISTLCALHGGLHAVATHLDHNTAAGTTAAIRAFILDQAATLGYLPKFAGSTAVDASLLWACTPFGVLPANHPVIVRTAEKVEADLTDPDGGVHRYAEDSYYGGGQWILLTALLGEYRLMRGDREHAERIAAWIELQAGQSGELPEQVPRHLNVPGMYEPWLDRWGSIASPLLWSHAAYLRLRCALDGVV